MLFGLSKFLKIATHMTLTRRENCDGLYLPDLVSSFFADGVDALQLLWIQSFRYAASLADSVHEFSSPHLSVFCFATQRNSIPFRLTFIILPFAFEIQCDPHGLVWYFIARSFSISRYATDSFPFSLRLSEPLDVAFQSSRKQQKASKK